RCRSDISLPPRPVQPDSTGAASAPRLVAMKFLRVIICALPRRFTGPWRSIRRHGPAGNVTEAGKAHQRCLAYGDVMDTGCITGGDEVAALERAAAPGRTRQCEGKC